jgi:hypothetical protein
MTLGASMEKVTKYELLLLTSVEFISMVSGLSKEDAIETVADMCSATENKMEIKMELNNA